MGTEEKEITAPSEWKKKSGAPLELPSGNVARVRRVSMQVYLKTGRIPNMLMAPVQKALSKGGEQLDDKDLAKVMEDPEALVKLFEMIDLVTVDAVLEPKVYPTPGDDEERNEDKLYVDEVDMNDKMFIFQWMVGGTSDLEQFRDQQAQQLGAVPSS